MSNDSSTATSLGDDQSIPLLPTFAAPVRKPVRLLTEEKAIRMPKNHLNDSVTDENNVTAHRSSSNMIQGHTRPNNDVLPLKKRARIIVPDTAVSPATQTLNELNGMDLLEDNLYTQLSQVSYSQALFDGNVCGDEDEIDDQHDVCNQVLKETKPNNSASFVATIYDPGYKVILGHFATQEEAERRKAMAKSAVLELRSKYGYLQMKDKDWLHTQLEAIGIRKCDHSPKENAQANTIATKDSALTTQMVEPLIPSQKNQAGDISKNLKEKHAPMVERKKEHPRSNELNLVIGFHEGVNEKQDDIPSHNDLGDVVNQSSLLGSEKVESIPDIPAYDGEPRVRARPICYGGFQIHLGHFYKSCGERRYSKAQEIVEKWKQLPYKLSVDWIKSELTRLGYRCVKPKKNAKVLDSTKPHHSEFHATAELEAIKVSTPSHNSIIPNEYTVHNITICQDGPFGCTLRGITVESVNISEVVSLNQEGNAYKSGLRENDIIIHSEKCDTDDIRFATLDEVKVWSISCRRPVSFNVIRRKTPNNTFTATEGVISFENIDISSLNFSNADIDRAIRTRRDFPKVPCCKKCNINETYNHHYLCHMHKKFSTSGAKEILVILLAGVRDGCQACAFEIKYGKKHPSLNHIGKCDRITKKNLKASNKRVTSNSKDGSKPLSALCADKCVNDRCIVNKSNRVDCNNLHKATQLSTKERYSSSVEVQQIDERNQSHVTPISASDKTSGVDRNEIQPNRNYPLILADESSEDQWVPCANPWGPMGFCDGDVLYTSAADYQYRNQIYGENPKRFVDEPFIAESSYCKTHSIKETVALKRDPLDLLEWGFEFSYHDFGGACIVDKVDYISPAADARIVGEPERVSAIEEGDIILLVNGKRVGGMTELDLSVELEVSRSWISLTVAKYSRDLKESNKSLNWRSIDDAIEFEAKEPQSSTQYLNRDVASALTNIVNDDKPRDFFSQEKSDTQLPHELFENNSALSNNHNNYSAVVSPMVILGTKIQEIDNRNRKPDDNKETDTDPSTSSKYDKFDSDSDSDENPWLPCICGADHLSQQESLFWIQCDECDAWFKCSPSCVGFSEDDAEKVDKWICADCSTAPIAGVNQKDSGAKKSIYEYSKTEIATPMKENISMNHPFTVATLVQVDDRSWMPGRYLGGGTAKILSYKTENEEYLYDVQYVHGGKESDVEAKYVSLYQPIDTPRRSRSSPSVQGDDPRKSL